MSCNYLLEDYPLDVHLLNAIRMLVPEEEHVSKCLHSLLQVPHFMSQGVPCFREISKIPQRLYTPPASTNNSSYRKVNDNNAACSAFPVYKNMSHSSLDPCYHLHLQVRTSPTLPTLGRENMAQRG